MERGRCFPAGHASAGYAWVALYFFFLAAAPRWRWLGLSTGLEYDPGIYSDTAELVALARVASKYGGRYISHMRWAARDHADGWFARALERHGKRR